MSFKDAQTVKGIGADNQLAFHNATKDGQAALVQWLKMPLDAPEKKIWLKELMRNPTVDFDFQNKILQDIKRASSQGYWPIGMYDPERLTQLPRPLTQVLQMGELESASELLDREVGITKQIRDEAILLGDLELIRRTMESKQYDVPDVPDYSWHCYLPEAVRTGNLEIVEYILSKLATSKEGARYLTEKELISVGEYGSLEIVNYIMDFLEKGERLNLGNAQSILYGAIGEKRWDLVTHILERTLPVLSERGGETLTVIHKALHDYNPRSKRS
jgi:hypothetical protein